MIVNQQSYISSFIFINYKNNNNYLICIDTKNCKIYMNSSGEKKYGSDGISDDAPLYTLLSKAAEKKKQLLLLQSLYYQRSLVF